MALTIHYDGDCPFCSRYVALVRIRKAAGPVHLANLRDDPTTRARFEAQGHDLDEGMIVETAGRVYHGADAINMISLMSSRSGVLNRLVATVLSVSLLARLLYPLLRAGRNAALFFLGRRGFRIPDNHETAFLALFTRLFGIYTILDIFIYTLDYKPLVFTPAQPVLLVLGLAAMLAPRWLPGLVLLTLVAMVDAWFNAPTSSNHTMIRTMLSFAFLGAGLWHWLRGSPFTRFFQDVRPVGRALLITMYVFGIFHKLNSDFLNPAVSCAVALWQQMPAPLAALDGPLMRFVAIYGTFAAEGTVLVMLLVRRWRGLGIVLGIAFHVLLALSNYQMYVTFSMLAVVLHLMFLSPAAAARITVSRPWRLFEALLGRPAGVAIVLSLLAVMAYAALIDQNTVVGLLWLALVALPFAAIALHGTAADPAGTMPPLLWSPLAPLNLVAALYVLNCLSPYLGFKTGQAGAMFSNLRIEGSRNNHLILSRPPGPLPYLQEVVILNAASGDPTLEYIARDGRDGLVPHHFHSLLLDRPDVVVTYTQNGVRHGPMTGAAILAAAGVGPRSAIERKLMVFRPVALPVPAHCSYY